MALAILLGGCAHYVDEGNVGPGPGTGSGSGALTTVLFPQTGQKSVDVLFVVDNSEGMAEEQQKLANSLDRLTDALRSYALGADGTGRPCNANVTLGCQIPNLHLGVISGDLGSGTYMLPSCEQVGGDFSKLQRTPRVAGCSPPSDPFISYNNGRVNAPGADAIRAIEVAFGCVVRLGTDGCKFQQPIDAARRALGPNANPGFLRADAALAIVFVTNKDDCSTPRPELFDPSGQALSDPLGPLTSFRCFEFGVRCDVNDRTVVGPRYGCVPSGDYLFGVADLAKRLAELKPKGQVVVAAIAGPTGRVEVGKDGDNPVLKPGCSSSHGTSVPAVRLEALVNAFAPNSYFASSCDPNYPKLLYPIGKKIKQVLGGISPKCLPWPALTANGEVACRRDDRFAGDQRCGTDCLDRAACTVTEIDGQNRSAISACPTELWYPASWSTERDCGSTCPCWRLVGKDDCTGAIDGSPYALDVLRGGNVPAGGVVELKCRISKIGWESEALGKLPRCE
ncbi:MAG: hypothetical protein KC503_39675 [Myxococcales bacterium]|nr:hypothetical protein [Myxococcales bacterium]